MTSSLRGKSEDHTHRTSPLVGGIDFVDFFLYQKFQIWTREEGSKVTADVINGSPKDNLNRVFQYIYRDWLKGDPQVWEIAAVAYQLPLLPALPATFTQPGDHLLAEPCTFFFSGFPPSCVLLGSLLGRLAGGGEVYYSPKLEHASQRGQKTSVAFSILFLDLVPQLVVTGINLFKTLLSGRTIHICCNNFSSLEKHVPLHVISTN